MKKKQKKIYENVKFLGPTFTHLNIYSLTHIFIYSYKTTPNGHTRTMCEISSKLNNSHISQKNKYRLQKLFFSLLLEYNTKMNISLKDFG